MASDMIKEEIRKEIGDENMMIRECASVIEQVEDEIDWIPSRNEYNEIKLSNHNDK